MKWYENVFKWVSKFGFTRLSEVVVFCYVGVILYPFANRFYVPALDDYYGILPVTQIFPLFPHLLTFTMVLPLRSLSVA